MKVTPLHRRNLQRATIQTKLLSPAYERNSLLQTIVVPASCVRNACDTGGNGHSYDHSRYKTAILTWTLENIGTSTARFHVAQYQALNQ